MKYLFHPDSEVVFRLTLIAYYFYIGSYPNEALASLS